MNNINNMRKIITLFIYLFSLLLFFGCGEQNHLVSSVSLDASSKAIVVGESFTLNATVSPTDAENQEVVWLSAQPLVATVDKAGLVKGVGAGQTSITVATSDGNRRAVCEVTVREKTIPAESIRLEPSSGTAYLNEPFTVIAVITPENATDQTLNWTTSNPEIATVSQLGKVTPVAEGEVKITATLKGDEKISGTCKLVIEKKFVPVSGIYISMRRKHMYPNDEFHLSATVYPENATNQTVIWKSSNPAVAMVSKDGTLTALDLGDTEVTASAEGSEICSVCRVRVIQKKEREKLAIEYFAEYDLNKDGTDFSYSEDYSKSGHFNWYVLNGEYHLKYNPASRNILTAPVFSAWRLPTLDDLRAIIPDLDVVTLGYVNFTKRIIAKNVQESIAIKGKTKTYFSDYLCAGNKIVYGLRFRGNAQAQLAAYRYEYKNHPKFNQNYLEIRVRYLGPIFTGELEDIANEAFWEEDSSKDIVRTFPAAGWSVYTDEDGIGRGNFLFVNVGATYWSTNVFVDYPQNAYTMYYSDKFANVGGGVVKYQGLSVRLIQR